ncbi:MAG: signal peptidase, partial [Thermoleophilaceae bacterium]|nr:signal peptidase [Thermoleophilaceae bacterium]
RVRVGLGAAPAVDGELAALDGDGLTGDRDDALEGVSYGPVIVRLGTVFVLGDNRASSEDSRAFGPVPLRRLIGRVLTRIWPPGRWGDPT